MEHVLESSSGNTLPSQNSSGQPVLSFNIVKSNCAGYSHRVISTTGTVRPATAQEVEMWFIIKALTEQTKIEQAKLERNPM